KEQGDYSRAQTFLETSLTFFSELGNREGMAAVFAGTAGVALAQGRLASATQLFSAAESVLKTINRVMWPADRVEYERDLEALRATLGKSEFHAAWAAGLRLTPAEALDLAFKTVKDMP